MNVKASIPERYLNLVVPLAGKATVKRITDTARAMASSGRSGAIALLSDRQCDVDSTIPRSPLPTTQSISGSMMAIRTTTTRTTRGACAPSAGSNNKATTGHADFSFEELVQAYFDCRKAKRRSASALDFEFHMERNLFDLDRELRSGSYQPGRSICFVITHPKPREVWAAEFRDRIVHHLMYNHVAPAIQSRFIADSCACITGRGTLYGAQRLESKVRSVTQNWTRPAFYLKADLQNFFVRISKPILSDLLAKHISECWWLDRALQILWHDPRTNYELRGPRYLLKRVPDYKRLTNQCADYGLPIGNLSSQFFANIYLNELDQFVKHELRCAHYIRYVDDFVLLHESPDYLNDALARIEVFLQDKLEAVLNPRKTILRPVQRGIDFVGQVILPHRSVTRRRTVKHALRKVAQVSDVDLMPVVNSYFGLMRQPTHGRSGRLKLARAVLRRGRSVDFSLTKTFRSARS